MMTSSLTAWLYQSTSSFIHPGVSKGVAVSNTMAETLAVRPEGFDVVRHGLVFARCSWSLVLYFSKTPCNCFR